MPCRNLFDTENNKVVTRGEAPLYFEGRGIMPKEAVELVIESLTGPRGSEDPRYLTPSQLCPDTNCRREICLERFVEYDLDPRKLWEACEGQIWHHAFYQRSGKHEIVLPDHLIAKREGPPTTGNIKVCEDGLMRAEIVSGIWCRGTVDNLYYVDGGDPITTLTIRDHKTQAYPKVYGDKPPIDFAEPDPKGRWKGNRHEWAFQFSAYALIAECVTGVPVKEIFAWRMYRGSKDRSKTFRKIPIKKWSCEKLQELLTPWVYEATEWLQRCYELKEEPERLLQFIRTLPMDGAEKHMFGGQKCAKYCSVASICMGQEFAF